VASFRFTIGAHRGSVERVAAMFLFYFSIGLTVLSNLSPDSAPGAPLPAMLKSRASCLRAASGV
jgi:hypothetical protein